MKRVYWILAAFACLCLSCAAVWLGGLNQDEGWYLYAANLVREGQRVYRDFAFTQGPVMPNVYANFTWIWAKAGLLGARVFTLLTGLAGIAFAASAARRLVRRTDCAARANDAALMVILLLGCNLYHLYYLAIPKTYALAALFVAAGFWCLVPRDSARVRRIACFTGGLLLALAAGVRISMGAVLPVVAVVLALAKSKTPAQRFIDVAFFALGAAMALAFSYGFVLLDAPTWKGFLAAQAYHAARNGFDLVWSVGSLSRLIRWYLPVFIVLGLAVARAGFPSDGVRRGFCAPIFLAGFLAVFVVQMLAPFPYEDYQVPIMGLLTVFAVVNFIGDREPGKPAYPLLLVLGLTFASSFGSPLLEKWTINGQDRFWSLKKEKSELAQLRDVARRIEELDPNGRDLFTQDLYLAIETNRRVPKGLEMGPFSILSDEAWRKLISGSTCALAAISGYTFAVDPPACTERPVDQQLAYFKLLKENYSAVERIPDFGQNATTLLLLKRK